MAIKLKEKEVDEYKLLLLNAQGWKCPLCGGSLKAIAPKNRVLDHDHDTGFCRAVICRGCNGAEGKVKSVVEGYGKAGNSLHFRIEWIKNLLAYWEKHKVPQTDRLYHKHKTPAELREARNRKARLAYAAKKGG
ncbi:endonuclease VII [Klebsiella phage VLCpiA2a]|nr:endonuclease VII [Klebsiella phage VLCpiA2a]